MDNEWFTSDPQPRSRLNRGRLWEEIIRTPDYSDQKSILRWFLLALMWTVVATIATFAVMVALVLAYWVGTLLLGP